MLYLANLGGGSGIVTALQGDIEPQFKGHSKRDIPSAGGDHKDQQPRQHSPSPAGVVLRLAFCPKLVSGQTLHSYKSSLRPQICNICLMSWHAPISGGNKTTQDRARNRKMSSPPQTLAPSGLPAIMLQHRKTKLEVMSAQSVLKL